MMLVCGTLQTVLCYTRYEAGVWHSPQCAVHIRYDAGGVALSRLCCGTLDMMLVCDTLQTLECNTRYVAGVWHSPDSHARH